jgi:hypothetical protein
MLIVLGQNAQQIQVPAQQQPQAQPRLQPQPHQLRRSKKAQAQARGDELSGISSVFRPILYSDN